MCETLQTFLFKQFAELRKLHIRTPIKIKRNEPYFLILSLTWHLEMPALQL